MPKRSAAYWCVRNFHSFYKGKSSPSQSLLFWQPHAPLKKKIQGLIYQQPPSPKNVKLAALYENGETFTYLLKIFGHRGLK